MYLNVFQSTFKTLHSLINSLVWPLPKLVEWYSKCYWSFKGNVITHLGRTAKFEVHYCTVFTKYRYFVLVSMKVINVKKIINNYIFKVFCKLTFFFFFKIILFPSLSESREKQIVKKLVFIISLFQNYFQFYFHFHLDSSHQFLCGWGLKLNICLST